MTTCILSICCFSLSLVYISPFFIEIVLATPILAFQTISSNSKHLLFFPADGFDFHFVNKFTISVCLERCFDRLKYRKINHNQNEHFQNVVQRVEYIILGVFVWNQKSITYELGSRAMMLLLRLNFIFFLSLSLSLQIQLNTM